MTADRDDNLFTDDSGRGDAVSELGDGYDSSLVEQKDGMRKNPPLTEGVEKLGTGGIAGSGGAAGGARGHGGTSDDGAGGPTGDSRGGPAEYKSTSRGDLDR